MKFYSESVWTPKDGEYVTIKTYYCPNCNYRRKIKEKGNQLTVLEGDKEFVLFPFSSLTKTDGSHVELVACPECQTVQYVDRVDNENEVDNTLH